VPPAEAQEVERGGRAQLALVPSCPRALVPRTLAVTIGEADAEHVTKLQRHLHWLVYYHGQGEPEAYLPDVVDITQRDLPAVIDLVEQWERRLLPTGLADAVSAS